MQMDDTNLSPKIELLKGTGLFATLHEAELAIIARNSAFYSFKEGDVVFHAGSHIDGLFIIKDGSVVISKQRDDQENVIIARFIRGECFGELDLLEDRLMTATARAETDADLLMFPLRGISFQDLLSRHSNISAQLLYKLLNIITGRIRATNRLLYEKSQWVQDLKNQLFYDKLTGMYNRIFLEEEFPSQLPDFGPETAIIMIKPDNFKAINDNCGHDIGDKALRFMAYCIKSQIRDQDIPLRYRGDEFAVIFPGTDIEKAAKFAEHIRLLFSKLKFDHITGGISIIVTASIGVAVFPGKTGDVFDLIRACFDKMFEARESGGDRILRVDA
jgi:diguanylate cyclase